MARDRRLPRLVKVKTDDNQTVIASYTYGDSNERLIREEGGLRTYYACDGKAEYTESGSSTTPAWSKSYVYLGARLLSTLTPNGSGGEAIQYHQPDRLGTRLVTNAQDTTHFEQVTLPFGTALNAESTGSTNRRFTSYDRSVTTGLDYAVNRHYDPQQARFTQVDSIGMGAASPDDPQSLNMYSYCGNDPVNRIDPEGLFFKKLFKWIGKVLKWIAVAVAVALIVVASTSIGAPGVGIWATLKMFIQAGSLLAGAFGKTKLSIALGIAAGVAGIIQLFREPDIVMNFLPQEGGVLNPGDIPGLTGPCPYGACAVTIPIEKLWHQRGPLRAIGNFAVGFADALTKVPFTNFSFVRWYDLRRGTRDADEGATAYRVGAVAGDLGQTAIPVVGVVGKLKRVGYAGKVGLHTAHHTFGRFGKLSHLQVMIYKQGVKGSHWIKRIPLPLRRIPKRDWDIKF